jgi:hypothetical protein
MSLHCYFRPISTCTRNTSRSFQFLDSRFDLSRGLERVGNATGLHSELLIMGTLLSWVMRPQRELGDAVGRYGAALGFLAGGIEGDARHRHIGMHIRRGDKYSLHSRHMLNHTWRVSPDSFVAWGRRVAADIGAERVIFMTDDSRIDLAAQSDSLFRFAPAPRECLPSHIMAGAALSRGSAHTAAAHRLQAIGAHPELLGMRTKGMEAKLAQDCGPDAFLDEGIQLFSGILLLANCAAFIGTQISNIASAVVELMATQRHPPVFYDVLNDMHRPFLSDERVWYGGVHNPSSVRPLSIERLAQGSGRATHGAWMEDSKQKAKGKAAAGEEYIKNPPLKTYQKYGR